MRLRTSRRQVRESEPWQRSLDRLSGNLNGHRVGVCNIDRRSLSPARQESRKDPSNDADDTANNQPRPPDGGRSAGATEQTPELEGRRREGLMPEPLLPQQGTDMAR